MKSNIYFIFIVAILVLNCHMPATAANQQIVTHPDYLNSVKFALHLQ